MDILWQQITTGVLLAGAALYLAFRFIRRRREKGCCPGCKVGRIVRPQATFEERDRQSPSR